MDAERVQSPEQAWGDVIGPGISVDDLLTQTNQAAPERGWAFEDAVRWYLTQQPGHTPGTEPDQKIVTLLAEHIRNHLPRQSAAIRRDGRHALLVDSSNNIVAQTVWSDDIPGSWEKAEQVLAGEAAARGLDLQGGA